MALILNIETATTVCSVSIGTDGNSMGIKEINSGYTHAENLTIFIRDILADNNLSFSELDAIAVSKGPGSYTGLRIGVSTAKGLCYTLNKPLIAINTLKSLTGGAVNNYLKKGEVLFCPMLDARRMEVYCAVYDKDLNEIKPTAAEIITGNSFAGLLRDNTLIFFGDGAAKCKATLTHSNASFIENAYPSAAYMTKLSEEAFNKKQFEDVAYFEPYYLKNFVGSKEKKEA